MKGQPPKIFDRMAYRAQRARAARLDSDAFLAREAAEHVTARIGAIHRRFARGLDVNSRPQAFSVLRAAADSWVRTGCDSGDIVADEEALPFADASFELITSILSLHAVNDLPGTLVQIRRGLKPDGLFIAALFGGETLKELKFAFAAAESEIAGGVTPRVSPFADVRDLGGLLQRAGFTLPVADVERMRVRYGDLAQLFGDLRALGETNILTGRRSGFLSRRLLDKVAAEYGARFSDPDGRIGATFEIVFLTGWAAHESQQKPLAPGSAKARLADALGTRELPAGEKPQR
jgi:SAM-dependent methyltransferase